MRGKMLLLTISVVFLILSRFLLLGTSARFVWDESDDLVRMQQIYENKRITLVGPISESNINVYGSLSYYMLMPFAVAFNFDPIGPVIGTAFYGVITILVLAFIFKKYFSWPFWLVTLFLIPLFPYLQSSRWAWNPNYIPFWQGLSILLILISINFSPKKKDNSTLGKLLPFVLWTIAGLFQGLTIHNHWYALFALVGVGITILVYSLKEKKLSFFVFFSLGAFLAILPFALFDLKNPPGLFLTRFLYFGPFAQSSHQSLNFLTVLTQTGSNLLGLFNYFFQKITITKFFIFFFSGYLLFFLKYSKTKLKLLLLIPALFSAFGLAFTGPNFFDHYVLAGVIFLLFFLMIPDYPKKFSKFQLLLLLYLFLFSLQPAYKEITKNTWMTNIDRTRKITNLIANNIDGQRCNVFAASSPDQNTVGKRYRDLLKVKKNPIMEKEEYKDYECLFVITTSDLNTINLDPAYELQHIRYKPPVNEWQIDNDWKVFKFKS